MFEPREPKAEAVAEATYRDSVVNQLCEIGDELKEIGNGIEESLQLIVGRREVLQTMITVCDEIIAKFGGVR